MTWEQFLDMFRVECVLLVERERLALEYPSLNQKIESIMEIAKIFTKRVLFCPECAASEQVHML